MLSKVSQTDIVCHFKTHISNILAYTNSLISIYFHNQIF